jgi:hypothetical protein
MVAWGFCPRTSKGRPGTRRIAHILTSICINEAVHSKSYLNASCLFNQLVVKCPPERKDMALAAPGKSKRFPWTRKHFNENIGLILTGIAAIAAALAWNEARLTRKGAHDDAMLSIKIAQRSYVDVQEHYIDWGGVSVAPTGEQVLESHHTVTVYGNSPAFQITETSNCKLGINQTIFQKGKDITADDLKPSPSRMPSAEWHVSGCLPDEIVPGTKYPSKGLCDSQEIKNPEGRLYTV